MGGEQETVGASPRPAPVPRWPVRFFLICLVLACLIPGLIGAVLLVHHDYLAHRATLERNSIQTTRALAQAVDSHLAKARAVAQSLAASDALRREDFAALYRQAREILALDFLGSSIALCDTSGQQIFNTSREFGEPLPAHGSPEQIRRMAETGQPAVSGVFRGNVSGQLLVTVDVPAIVGGRVAYIVTAVMRPQIFDTILKAQGLPPDWTVGILDHEGTFVTRTHAPEQFIGGKPDEELSRRIARAAEEVLETRTPDGLPVLMIYSRSPATGWTVVLGIPSQSLEAEYRQPLRLLVAGMVILFTAGLGLAWWVGEKITRSVRALATAAQALGMGKAVSVPGVCIKEAGEVAWALADASDLLQKRNEALRQTNKNLLAREAELAQAHRLAKFGTWYWNLRTGEFVASDSLRAVYGREAIPSFPEMRGTLLTVDSWERAHAAIQATLRTGEGYDLELQAIHGGGSLIWVNTKGEAVLDEYGAVVALRGSVLDITERKRAQQELLEAETRFRSTFEQAAVGMALVGLDGRWMQVNDRLCAIVDYPRETLLGLTFQDITVAEDLAEDLALLEQLLAGRISSYSLEKRYVRRDGVPVWVNLTVALVRTPGGEPDYFVAVIEDIQRRKEAEAALARERENRQRQLEQLVAERTEALQAAIRESERLARRDALTGLQNRLSANERLREEFLRMKRTGRPYAALLLDIDHFKRINDSYGHETGDHVLRQVADILLANVRATDFVSRFGGEEFLVLLPETETEGAATIAEKIRSMVAAARFPVAGRVTLSIGFSRASPEDGNEDEAVRRADAALYEAKRLGRDRVQALPPG